MEEIEYRIEVIDGIQIIDYSKGKNIHIRFNYLGEPTEENPNGSYEDGGHIEFKFKDPRDILRFLTKNFELLGMVESSKLFDYVFYNTHDAGFSQLEVYYLLLLEIKLPFINFFRAKHPIPRKDFKDFTEEELKDYKANCNQFREEFESSIREAHKFAVANTWKVWNDIQYTRDRNIRAGESGEVAFSEEDIKRCSIPKELLFDTNYKGKEVDIVYGLNLHRRLWKVYFKDGSWIIASDQGNGWYAAKTDFNSYKLIGRS